MHAHHTQEHRSAKAASNRALPSASVGTVPDLGVHLHVLSRFTCQHARQPPAGRPVDLTQSIPRLRFLPEV